MARLLILSLVFPPDNVSTAQIMGALATDLQACGHRVFVLTTVPHYNDDQEAQSRQPLRAHWTGFLWRSYCKGIPVFHAWMPRKRRSKLHRLTSWIGFHFI